MKKIIILIFAVAALTILFVIALAIYKFDFTKKELEKKVNEVKIQNTTSTINIPEKIEPVIIPPKNDYPDSSEPSFRTPVGADPNSFYIQ